MLYILWSKNSPLLELEFKISSSDDEISKDVATNKEIGALESNLKEALSISYNLQKMQNNSIQMEEKFSESQANNSSSVVFYCILQIVLVLVAGVCQFYTIKKIYNKAALIN